MRVRFLLVRLPFQRSVILVLQDVEGEWGGAIPIVAPGETIYEDQFYHFVQELKAGRPVREAQELGVFEFPDPEAAQEAARSLAESLKTSLWDEEEASPHRKRRPDQIDMVLLLTVGGLNQTADSGNPGTGPDAELCVFYLFGRVKGADRRRFGCGADASGDGRPF